MSNVNIEDYSIDELLNIISLNNPTKEEIIKKVEFLNSNYFSKQPKVKEFLLSIIK